tara:strand:+ start:2001 stop:2411 length:411 start_codon:yes stop_codon:yes gene_type:complete
MAIAILVSQIPSEAARDAIARGQNHESVRREVDLTLNKSTAPMANQSTSTTGAADAEKSLMRVGQVAQIGARKRMQKQTTFRCQISANQTDLQQPTIVSATAHSARHELRRQIELNRAVERRSAGEQQPLIAYRIE